MLFLVQLEVLYYVKDKLPKFESSGAPERALRGPQSSPKKIFEMGLQIKKVSHLFLVQKKGLHNVEEKSTKIRVPIGPFRGLENSLQGFHFFRNRF